jgi:hypothetical protein
VIWWLLGILVAAVAPILGEILRRPMQGAARATTKGTFIRLRKGLTHFRWCWPEDGALVVCVQWVTTSTVCLGQPGSGFCCKGLSGFGL